MNGNEPVNLEVSVRFKGISDDGMTYVLIPLDQWEIACKTPNHIILMPAQRDYPIREVKR